MLNRSGGTTGLRGLSEFHRSDQHEGAELLYVLKGTLLLTLARQNRTLEAGDSVHFDSGIPHRIAAGGDTDAGVLLISYVKRRRRTVLAQHDAVSDAASRRTIQRRAERDFTKLRDHPACGSLDPYSQ